MWLKVRMCPRGLPTLDAFARDAQVYKFNHETAQYTTTRSTMVAFCHMNINIVIQTSIHVLHCRRTLRPIPWRGNLQIFVSYSKK